MGNEAKKYRLEERGHFLDWACKIHTRVDAHMTIETVYKMTDWLMKETRQVSVRICLLFLFV